jgi:arylamine N-acetyltransferase
VRAPIAAIIMATYSKDQLLQYFEHINLPTKWRTAEPSLDYLTELFKRQFSTVPFENISLHYSESHLLSLDTEDLFLKVVGRGRGGYCMENNRFFGTVLRSLGFRITDAGARVSEATSGRPGGRYNGWRVIHTTCVPDMLLT